MVARRSHWTFIARAPLCEPLVILVTNLFCILLLGVDEITKKNFCVQ